MTMRRAQLAMPARHAVPVGPRPAGTGGSDPRRAVTPPEETYTLARRLVIVLYVLLLFEGALRKWVAPQWVQPLFFVKEPVLLALYLAGARALKPPYREKWLLMPLLIAPMAVVIGSLKVLQGTLPVEVFAYGFRNYFLYIPLPILMARVCTSEDWRRIVRITGVIAVPVAALVVWQFQSPLDHPVNAGFVDRGLVQLLISEDRVRTYGLFTSGPGQNMYNATLLIMVLWTWLTPRSETSIGPALRALATAAALTSLAFSGSRGALIQTGLIIATTIAVFTVLSARGRMKMLATVLLLGGLAAYALPRVFPETVDVTLARVQDAAAGEATVYRFGTFGRILGDFTSFVGILPQVPIEGFGVGSFGNARVEAAADYVRARNPTEDDWSRNVAELGLWMGLFFILWRVICAFQFWRIAIANIHSPHAVLCVLLAAFLSTTFLAGQMTAHGSVHGYTWMFCGFLLLMQKALLPRNPVADPGGFRRAAREVRTSRR